MPYRAKVCVNCKRTYRPTTSRGKYCSSTCAIDCSREMNAIRLREKFNYTSLWGRVCLRCGDKFNAKGTAQRYCSSNCRDSVRLEMERVRRGTVVNTHCIICNCELPEFLPSGARRRADVLCCSHECYVARKRERERPPGAIPQAGRTCKRCGITFDATSNKQKFCNSCGPTIRKQKKRKRRDELAIFPAKLERWSVAYFNNECPICSEELETHHLDHWYPFKPRKNEKGLPLRPGNGVPLCPDCNKNKNNLPPFEWLTKRVGTDAMNIFLEVENFLAEQEVVYAT